MLHLSESIRSQINDAYRRMLAGGGKRRAGQKRVIAEVAHAVANAGAGSSHGRLVVHAPTGIGKTVAYVLGAMPGAKAAGLKVIIATSSVALQDQLANRDLPAILGFVGGARVVNVKGRSRYVCPIRLREAGASGSEMSPLARELSAELAQGWSGVVDDLREPPKPAMWAKLTSTAQGCSGGRCSEYAKCPFQSARAAVDGADVVVTNQDLLVSDGLGGNHTLPPLGNSVLIVDEAHDLPTKAAAQMESEAAVGGGSRLAGRGIALVMRVAQTMGELRPECAKAQAALTSLQSALEMAHDVVASEVGGQGVRFSRGLLPDWMRPVAAGCAASAKKASDEIGGLVEAAREIAGAYGKAAEEALGELGALAGTIDTFAEVWGLISEGSPSVAKWIESQESDFRVCAADLAAGEKLRSVLWQKAAAVVCLSATIKSVGGFRPFLAESGLDGAQTLEVESPFDFESQARIVVPRMASPKQGAGHAKDVVSMLNGLLSGQENGTGALVLFTSWAALQHALEGVSPCYRGRILVQGQVTKQAMLKQHMARIDAGEPSVIFGTQTFEQGIDLPGRYLTLVVATKLPFEVPNTPSSEARRELVEAAGGDYFGEVILPKACTRLCQLFGRLIRSESDSGTVVIADPRVTHTRFGKALLDALPAAPVSQIEISKLGAMGRLVGLDGMAVDEGRKPSGAQEVAEVGLNAAGGYVESEAHVTNASVAASKGATFRPCTDWAGIQSRPF